MLLLLIIIAHASCAKTVVVLYTYYEKPPFIIDLKNNIGLSFDLASELNHFAQNYHFELVYLPKQRATNKAIEAGALLWVNPSWVNGTNTQTFLWTKPVMYDRELYVTNDKSLIFSDNSSLYNKTLVGVRGYHYFNLNELIKQGNVLRHNVDNETTIAKMLANKRGDFGVMGLQTYSYIIKQNPEYKNQLYILEGYVKPFTRSIAVSSSSPAIYQKLIQFFQSDRWIKLKDRWLIHRDDTAQLSNR
ncbi:ABC transporter substrate-binding protein [Catenovulum agarivorans DS-2]|uniref:ABC transporter substrate-binding protein n=2 Tax=Catenovulum agarivorans TaxID=1172192 RepID=W7R3M6_9ALTE|nr:ABC transporter substrate-binding protein [Catenovulum agarivorans DS-2]